MNGIIHMTAQIENQVFTDNAHQVVADHADIIIRCVFANICVDSRKALGNSAATFHSSFVNQKNRLTIVHPFFYLKRCTAGSHTTADDQNINFFFLNFRIPDSLGLAQRFIR